MSRERDRASDSGSQEPAQGAMPAVDTRLLVREEGVKGYVGEFRRKLRSGELGSLPVILAVIIIWTVFGTLDSTFLSAQNLSDLSQQIVGTGMIAVGIVFVLLLGEIDLSVGSVSGLCAAIFAVLNVLNGMNEWLALLIAIGAAPPWGSSRDSSSPRSAYRHSSSRSPETSPGTD